MGGRVSGREERQHRQEETECVRQQRRRRGVCELCKALLLPSFLSEASTILPGRPVSLPLFNFSPLYSPRGLRDSSEGGCVETSQPLYSGAKLAQCQGWAKAGWKRSGGSGKVRRKGGGFRRRMEWQAKGKEIPRRRRMAWTEERGECWNGEGRAGWWVRWTERDVG